MLMKNSSSRMHKRKGAVRTYKASDNEKYRVTFSDFDKYCRTLMATLRIAVLQQGGKEKNSNRVRIRILHLHISDLYNIDQGSRLLLRELIYCMASLNTSYVDNIVSDEDKTDALQALMQVFKSMAYVTFRLSVGAVTARKSIHIEDLA